jgi:hypothetical protein
MRTDSTVGPGNLAKAGSGTTRYMVTFSLSKDGQTESRQRAWHAPTEKKAMTRVQRHYENEGFICTVLSATEIPNSHQP